MKLYFGKCFKRHYVSQLARWHSIFTVVCSKFAGSESMEEKKQENHKLAVCYFAFSSSKYSLI